MSKVFKFSVTDGIEQILSSNKAWAKRMAQEHPGLFALNAQGQSPHILWIGCADSRAGEQCVDFLPGEVLVHRNVANIVPYTDISSLSVLQLAIDIVKVKHVVICGHYDCAGVWASLYNKRLGGEMDAWLRNVQQVKAQHLSELDALKTNEEKARRLVELNVITQVHNVSRNDRVQRAIKQRGLQLHGVVYECGSGELKSLVVPNDKEQRQFDISTEADNAH